MRKLTRPQIETVHKIWQRSLTLYGCTTPLAYRDFRRLASFAFGTGALMVPLGSLWLGIEPDGYNQS